jgi:alanine racemase
MHCPLKLNCSRQALGANYRWLQGQTQAAVGAAIKADGYGLGARQVADVLALHGCRDFFVSTWFEAAQLEELTPGFSLRVLHGVGSDDLALALKLQARPVLNSPMQVARWKEAAPGKVCDVMIDTGMNRLGLRPEEIVCLEGLRIDTLHSHLSCADEDTAFNEQQRHRFAEVVSAVPARCYSLANSAGILLGPAYHFDMVRPGLALYGGVPRPEAFGHTQAVASLQAQVVQRRLIPAGESCGYSATFVARHDLQAAIINIGYADGYWRGFSSRGHAIFEGCDLPVIGRVSMDLVILDCSAAPGLREGNWVELDFDLPRAAQQSGMSQYELLTGLADRFDRHWS